LPATGARKSGDAGGVFVADDGQKGGQGIDVRLVPRGHALKIEIAHQRLADNVPRRITVCSGPLLHRPSGRQHDGRHSQLEPQAACGKNAPPA
jgi:hypothetical protein